MRMIKITRDTNDQHRQILIRFIQKYGDNHITKKAIDWLKQTPFKKLTPENGDLIYVMVDQKMIVGVLAIIHYGLKQAFIVVHPKTRKKGIAYQLITEAQKFLDRFYVKVANDNIPSLKLCFATDMQAFALTKGPTGKPTLILGWGNWSKEEWESSL
ncbi:GNAT family N-acetyltransferase [Tepidibacillus sp. LV47]|uniref:GNAT family N-acetyltransferase n=1 Tax=Tepidibacillus sp. LV47 TaxID=3398228 RepID=UPI003AAAF693